MMEKPGRHVMLDNLVASITAYELAYLVVEIDKRNPRIAKEANKIITKEVQGEPCSET